MDVSEMQRLFTRGGGGVIDFLNYCIISAKVEPLFVYLVEQEYKHHASKKRAMAIYDVFCAPTAAFRVNADQYLPPTDTTLSTAIQTIQNEHQQASQMNIVKCKFTAGSRKPTKLLFDRVVQAVRGVGNENCLSDICNKYDPTKDTMDNLGGQITSIQKSYIRSTWVGATRNTLIAAGFKIIPSLFGGGL